VFDLKKPSMMGQSTLEAPSEARKPTKERSRAQIIFFKMLKISNNIYLSKKKNMPRKLKKLEVLRNI